MPLIGLGFNVSLPSFATYLGLVLIIGGTAGEGGLKTIEPVQREWLEHIRCPARGDQIRHQAAYSRGQGYAAVSGDNIKPLGTG